MDPDCLWRSQSTEECQNPEKQTSTELESLARVLSQETRGHFNILRTRTSKRDFSGLSQGYFLDILKRTGRLLVNFSGDIYYSGDFKPSKKFVIGDPFLPTAAYADVHLSSGWMISSGSGRMGADIYFPNGSSKSASEFLQMTLFAKRGFNGARLDAWATALMAGGSDLLEHLWNQTDYQGQWAYFFFDSKGAPKCSPNIRCQLSTRPYSIDLPWD
ncbi:MAG: FAD:protein FMN transferase [Pseudomonadota bacterium]